MLHSGKALPGTEGQKNTATKKTSLLISNVFRKRSWLKGENVKKRNEEKPQLKRIRRQERGSLTFCDYRRAQPEKYKLLFYPSKDSTNEKP